MNYWDEYEWHRVFAWWPIKCEGYWVWLSSIECRRTCIGKHAKTGKEYNLARSRLEYRFLEVVNHES